MPPLELDKHYSEAREKAPGIANKARERKGDGKGWDSLSKLAKHANSGSDMNGKKATTRIRKIRDKCLKKPTRSA